MFQPARHPAAEREGWRMAAADAACWVAFHLCVTRNAFACPPMSPWLLLHVRVTGLGHQGWTVAACGHTLNWVASLRALAFNQIAKQSKQNAACLPTVGARR